MKIGTSGTLYAAHPMTKVLVYGPTGAGKTRWASLAPKPLILLFEPQGLQTIASVRDDATCIVIESWREFKRVFDAVKIAPRVKVNGQPALSVAIDGHTFDMQTLVIDSLTELQRNMLSDVCGLNVPDRYDLTKTVQVSTPQYGRLWDVMREVLVDLRSMPCSVVVTALSEDKYDDASRRKVVIDLVGKASRKVGQHMNAVGYMTENRDGNRVVVWVGDARLDTKPAPGWPRMTSANIGLGALVAFTQGDGDGVPMESWDSLEAVAGELDTYGDAFNRVGKSDAQTEEK